MLARVIFLFCLGLVLAPWGSPPLALVLGIGFGMAVAHPWAAESRAASKWLLQASVVGLGFGMDPGRVLEAGRAGLGYTAAGIVATLGLGWVLGEWLGVGRRSSLLISVGTAICGGSAIAAVGPVVGARDEEMSVSLGTVFILNAVALLIFPVIGHWWGLSEGQFGLWAALAIHDTSSVVGAAARYGAESLVVGTTVKLARALWIVPLTLVAAWVVRRRAGGGSAKVPALPWFVLLFCLAAVVKGYVPAGAEVYPWLVRAGRTGLTVTLFLIGSGVSRETLRRVGVRPLVQGLLLWLVVGSLSLLVISFGWIG